MCLLPTCTCEPQSRTSGIGDVGSALVVSTARLKGSEAVEPACPSQAQHMRSCEVMRTLYVNEVVHLLLGLRV